MKTFDHILRKIVYLKTVTLLKKKKKKMQFWCEVPVIHFPAQTIPVISFIAGGGINTMKLVSQSVINGIPVLVRENSGGAADFIKRGMEIIKKDSGNSTLYELDMADKLVA